MSKNEKRFELGERVNTYAFLTKNGDRWRRHYTGHEPIRGIITAQRTRKHTWTETEYDEQTGRTYRTTMFGESFVAYDITFDLHRRPVICLPNDIETEETTDAENQ